MHPRYCSSPAPLTTIGSFHVPVAHDVSASYSSCSCTTLVRCCVDGFRWVMRSASGYSSVGQFGKTHLFYQMATVSCRKYRCLASCPEFRDVRDRSLVQDRWESYQADRLGVEDLPRFSPLYTFRKRVSHHLREAFRAVDNGSDFKIVDLSEGCNK